MKKNQKEKILTLLLTIALNGDALCQSVEIFTVGFYNLENLFDPSDNPETFDEDYTPAGRKQWTEKILEQKIDHLAAVISKIGFEEVRRPPLLLGVAEIENLRVLKMLVHHKKLLPYQYEILHYDSPDARGIDVALLYQKAFFIPSQTKVYSLTLYDGKTNQKRTTRDQLVVSGWMNEEEIHCLVNHWPSRRGGQKRSESNRISAARLQQKIIDSLMGLNHKAKIISMGDFNDNPDDKSLLLLTKEQENSYRENFQPLLNPMEKLYQKGVGSLAYRDRWFLFDQILITPSLIYPKGVFFVDAKVFSPDFLKNNKGKYKGYPFRSEVRGQQLYGYADHFPVYALFGKMK
ncbi:MAG: endonuclease/exonuclease/phosphatase family protein [Flavobacteriaceae bacterium]